ncbi:MAG: acyltransferase family protein [Myxococcales bacterium]|nr:acyltransferase family protein [Myxococcales bacterium]
MDDPLGDVTHALSVLARDAIPAARGLTAAVRARLDALAAALLGPDFQDRLDRLPIRLGPTGVDPFGFDPDVAKYAMIVAAFLHRVWFRTEVHGIENVPRGRVLLISNHSGQLPLDGMVIGATMFLDAEPPRFIRSMVEKWTQTLPFVGTFFTRCGQVVGVPENARTLLRNEEMLLVFPEGSRGISKPISRRYQLTDFGLGFMRLALETETPIVPIAVVGAEEQYLNFGNVDAVSRLFGMPSFPLMPQFLIPGGQLPLPVKYRLYVGEPLLFDGDPDDDDSVIEEKVWMVRATIQSMINRGLKERRGIFF